MGVDNNTIVFNQPEARHLFDTETGEHTVQAWPANPLVDVPNSWRLGGAKVSYFGFHARFSPTHSGFWELDVIDLSTGDMTINDLLVNASKLSFDERGTRIVFDNPENALVLLDLQSGEHIAMAIPETEQSIFENAGYFFPSNDGMNIVFHTDTASRIFTDQIYLVKLNFSEAEILPFCLVGANDYHTHPSWSRDEHYVFTMWSVVNQTVLIDTYVYDAHNHVLERVIDHTQFDNYLAERQTVTIVDWGIDLSQLPG